jgi:hypothetical protein
MGAFSAFATWFMVSSAWQIIAQAFGLCGPPAGRVALAPPCAQALKSLVLGIDVARIASEAVVTGRAPAGAASSSEGAGIAAAASSVFRAELVRATPDAADLEATCVREPGGAMAVAALHRLRAASEGSLVRGTAEIVAARRDIEAYLPPEPSSPPGLEAAPRPGSPARK